MTIQERIARAYQKRGELIGNQNHDTDAVRDLRGKLCDAGLIDALLDRVYQFYRPDIRVLDALVESLEEISVEGQLCEQK